MKKLLLILIFAISILTAAQSQTWTNTGLTFPSIVYTITDYNGALQVGGAFSTPNEMRAQCVYNGDLYSGGTNGGSSTNVYKNGVSIGAVNGNSQMVWTMAVYNNELYAAGSFTSINGVAASNIARWNGTVWAAVSTGAATPNTIIAALCVYNGSLYAGGQGIANLLKWNGTTWSSAGVFSEGGAFGYIRSMAVYSSALYVGGSFDDVDGVAALNLAIFNGGFWQSAGDIGVAGAGNGVSALAEYNGELYCGGSFGVAGGVSVNNVARGNGASWQPLGTGTGIVYALHVFNQALYVGGGFNSAGGITVSNIAKWAPPCAPPTASITYQGANTVCNPGGSLLLSANTGTGLTYQWKSGNSIIGGATSATYLVGSAGGIFSVIVTNAGGCSATSAQVVINTTFSAASATPFGPISICSGGSLLLTAYIGNFYTYQWKNNGVAIAGATASTYSVTTAGNYTVEETYGPCTKTSNTVIVNVNALPTASISPNGNLSFCTGAGITLQANTGAGLTYQWRKNSVNIAGATSTSYLANSTGTFNVVVTNANGCSKGATAVNVTSPPSNTVTANGPTNFCTGGSVTLTSTSGQTVTYQWRKNGANIAGATAATYAATSTGNYNCVVTNSFGCSKGGTPISVTGPPSAVITANGPTTFCAGGSVQLSAQSGYTYQWIKNSVNISGATQQNYVATTTGNYKVKVTNAFGCSKTTPNTNQIVVSVPCRAAINLSDVERSEIPKGGEVIKVFPNPFANELTVYVGSATSSHGLAFTVGDRIQLINLLGEVVLKQNVHGTASNLKLETSNLHSGIYFLTVQTAAGNKTVKVVKQ